MPEIIKLKELCKILQFAARTGDTSRLQHLFNTGATLDHHPDLQQYTCIQIMLVASVLITNPIIYTFMRQYDHLAVPLLAYENATQKQFRRKIPWYTIVMEGKFKSQQEFDEMYSDMSDYVLTLSNSLFSRNDTFYNYIIPLVNCVHQKLIFENVMMYKYFKAADDEFITSFEKIKNDKKNVALLRKLIDLDDTYIETVCRATGICTESEDRMNISKFHTSPMYFNLMYATLSECLKSSFFNCTDIVGNLFIEDEDIFPRILYTIKYEIPTAQNYVTYKKHMRLKGINVRLDFEDNEDIVQLMKFDNKYIKIMSNTSQLLIELMKDKIPQIDIVTFVEYSMYSRPLEKRFQTTDEFKKYVQTNFYDIIDYIKSSKNVPRARQFLSQKGYTTTDINIIVSYVLGSKVLDTQFPKADVEKWKAMYVFTTGEDWNGTDEALKRWYDANVEKRHKNNDEIQRVDDELKRMNKAIAPRIKSSPKERRIDEVVTEKEREKRRNREHQMDVGVTYFGLFGMDAWFGALALNRIKQKN